MLRIASLLLLPVLGAHAAKDEDLVTQPLPGFPMHPFKLYSGFLNVTGPIGDSGYDSLVIHYQFDCSQRNATTDPVVAWHTGGPGGSSIYGEYGELGWFQVSDSGEQVNSFAWNRVANMVFFESPAGSFISPAQQDSGFSYCLKEGKRQAECVWNDVTQAQAYALTMNEFFKQFPEFAHNDLYLTGESYAGQYIPNIANEILTNPANADLAARLKGIAVGNGCWGGDNSTVMCNGPNEERDTVALYHGKGLFSDKLHDQIQTECKFPAPSTPPSNLFPRSSA